MKLHYVKVNPSGNTTVFILDPVPQEQYAAVGRAVMSHGNVGAEQVAYLTRDSTAPGGWHLEMAGGEFCCNASRSFAAWMNLCPDGTSLQRFPEQEREQLVSVSGAKEFLLTRLTRMEQDNRCWAKIDLPLPLRVLEGRDDWFGDYTLVIFEGISHLVLWNRDPVEGDVEKTKEFLLSHGPMPDAFGILYYDGGHRFMSPLVCVPESGTLVWENSCGSGTSALAAGLTYRGEQDLTNVLIRQPGGDLRVDALWDGEKHCLNKLSLGGVVEFTSMGELYVDL